MKAPHTLVARDQAEHEGVDDGLLGGADRFRGEGVAAPRERGARFLYTRKAEIYGCCIKLLTEVEYVAARWDDNFYSMAESVRSHGRLIVLEEPGRPMSVRYEPLTKTAFLVNVDYYGWVKSIALAVGGDVLEDQHRIYSFHGAAIDIGGRGVSLIAPPRTGKTTHSWGLLRLREARLVADDWYFVRLFKP